MAESGLSLAFSGFRQQVGRYLGYGGDSANWTSDQSSEITEVVLEGLRRFYQPEIIDPTYGQHRWSFLYPTRTLSTVANDYDYTLPDNVGQSVEGDMTFAGADGSVISVRQVDEQMIRDMRQGTSTVPTGYPRFFAVRPISTAETTGQRFEAIFWPTPDAAYTLSYRYYILKDAIDATNPYPMGGQPHASTILASCLAVAEQWKDDAEGLHTKVFMRRLAASIEFDRKAASPKTLGGNLDHSVHYNDFDRERTTDVTVGGVQY